MKAGDVAIQWSVPVWMWPLLLVMAAGAVVLAVAIYRRTVPDPGLRLRRLLTVLRGTTLALLVLAVAGPVASCLRPRVLPAELVFVLEDSGSMALSDAPADTAAPSRWARSLAAVAAVDSVFDQEQPGVRRVLLRGNGLVPLQEFSRADAVIPPPTRHGTSLAGLARRLRERTAGRPVRAVVLLSDGAETESGGREEALANAAAALPLRVLGVGAGPETPDRALVDVRHAPVAYAGDDVVVEFAVAQASPAAAPSSPLVVTLSDELGVLAADTLAVEGAVAPGQLTFRPRGEGLQALRLEASPLVAERFLANNRATIAVDVRRDRARVLVVAGTPGWDVRFLALAAAAERRLDLTVAYPTPRGLVLADSLQPWQPPTTAAGWARWNAVVLTGWSGADGRLDWTALEQAVTQGLGLLVLPSAAVGTDGGPVPQGPPAALAELLPVAALPWRWEAGDRFATIAASGRAHPVLDGVAESGQDAALATLPPWRAVVRAAPRPGAVTLLEARSGAGDPGVPALVVAPRGRGRVAWLGVRQAWEWAFWERPGGGPEASPQPARRVLRNLLVWVAGGAGQAGLDFTSRPGVYQEGQPIHLGASWRDLRGEPVTDRTPSLVVHPVGPGADTTAVQTFALQPVAAAPGTSEVEVPPLAPGRYAVRLAALDEPPVTGPGAELVVDETSVERAQVRQDRARLEQLAARAGGSYHDLARPGAIDSLASELLALDWRGAEDRQRRRLDLWAGWPFIVLVTGLLGVEWFLRRRHGLL